MRIERKTISGLKNHYYDATRKTTTTKNKTKRKNTGRTKKKKTFTALAHRIRKKKQFCHFSIFTNKREKQTRKHILNHTRFILCLHISTFYFILFYLHLHI